MGRGRCYAPATTPSRTDRVAGAVLLTIAGFIALALHLPTYLDTVSGSPTDVGNLTSPTAFWLVKFMDLGIVVPAAVVVGVGMLRGRRWAVRPMCALVGGYALLGSSVAAMAVTMLVAGDDDSSLAMVVASCRAALALLGLAAYLYRPLLRGQPAPPVLRRDVRQEASLSGRST